MSTVASPLQVAKPIVLDLLAAITFAAAFFIAKRGFDVSGLHSVYIATVVGIGTGFAQLVLKRVTHEEIGPLQWLSLGVAADLPGLMTIALHNEHYIELKPSAIDLSVGIFHGDAGLDDALHSLPKRAGIWTRGSSFARRSCGPCSWSASQS